MADVKKSDLGFNLILTKYVVSVFWPMANLVLTVILTLSNAVW